MNNKTAGIIGVGLMGHGIATNIQKNGWTIGLLDHEGNQPINNLTTAGATVYQSVEELGHACEVIILCVTGSPQVESILTGADSTGTNSTGTGGLLQFIKKDTVIIDCSTAIPASTIRMAELVKQAGGQFLDAPMTRTPKEAAQGKLNLIVGGNKTLYESQLPLLQTFAENIVYAGDAGAGHTMKLLHNYVSLGFSTVLAEAAAAAKASGIDAEILHEVLSTGGGAGTVLDRMAPFILQQEVGSFSFTLANSAKDLSYYTEMCTDLTTSSRVAESISITLQEQVENGNGDAFVPQLINLL